MVRLVPTHHLLSQMELQDSMITSAQAIVRGMRGESHSYLLDTKDGNHYVTKFAGSPLARRRLVNEWVGSQLLSHLGLATPSVRMVETTADFIQAHSGKLSATGLDPAALRGPHFGSQFPGDPATSVVYDFLPDRFLVQVENLDDFVGTLIVDLWCGKMSRRQAIFIRSQERTGWFRALMIDNGDLFGGEAWLLDGAGAPALHLSLAAYTSLRSTADLAPWLTKIQNIPESFFRSLASIVPTEWVGGHGLELDALLRQLSFRRSDLRSRVLSSLRPKVDSLPSWVDETPVRMGPRPQRSEMTFSNHFVA